MADGDPPQTGKPEPLDNIWRGVLVVLAVALLVVAGFSWFDPPTKVAFAPSATTAAGNTMSVEDRSETLAVLLIGLAVLSLLVAANGRKLTSVKVGTVEVSTDAIKEAGKAAGLAEAEARNEGLDPAHTRLAAQLAEAKVLNEAFRPEAGSLIVAMNAAEAASSAVEEVRAAR